jgi:L-fuconolactonase
VFRADEQIRELSHAVRRQYWLALTQEPALEQEPPICDPITILGFSHDAHSLPAVSAPELSDDMRSGHNVRSMVFIEARAMRRADGPEEIRPVGEVEFVPCASCRHLFDLCSR